jgi:hypothetical protein
MTADTFFKELQTLKAYRETRLRLADTVLQNTGLLKELLRCCFLFDQPVSSRACWVLEFVCHRRIEAILPYADEFTRELSNFKLDSSKRPVAKICQLLILAYFGKKSSAVKEQLTEVHIQRIMEAAFDWLINNEKVAVKVYAMYTLVELGKMYEWIYPELQFVFEKDIQKQSSGYRAAVRKIKAKLSKD